MAQAFVKGRYTDIINRLEAIEAKFSALQRRLAAFHAKACNLEDETLGRKANMSATRGLVVETPEASAPGGLVVDTPEVIVKKTEDEDANEKGILDVMSRETCLIFFVFCLGVQIFMAYNAGATTGSIEIIEQEDGWSAAGLGVLGGMDKFGMTISSPFWGYMLQFHEARFLISGGLFVNACFTLVFATSRNHNFMLFAKLMMGISEGLQWVWSQIWVVSKAGGYPLFLNLNGVSAGAGTVVGTAISGFSTAHGLSYGFAFKVEGAVLLALWAGLMLQSTKSLTVEEKDTLTKTPSGTFAAYSEQKPLKTVIRGLLRNKVYMCTAFVFAFDNFVVLGIQFLWKRLFMSVWKVGPEHATTSLIVVPVIGSAIGAAAGSAWSFKTEEQVKSTLKKCSVAAFIGVFFAVVAEGGIAYQTLWGGDAPLVWYGTLGATYVGFAMVSAGLTAEMGAIVGICTDCIKDNKERSVSVGMQQGIMNFFGLTLAPVIPQMVMQLAGPMLGLQEAKSEEELDPPPIILAGVTATLSGTALIFFLCLSAYRAAGSGEKSEPLLGGKS
mmetsp:Transcript_129634/g.235614  ORF Transcript_129634/g.235614 Transcript_129634/m.235614 type:complete len:555 (+) Transcript_129634:68-1732(+)